tara:strand:- start:494 stop:688 length:195 start_codon:yes stop_codon:yes gene_type:complete
MKIIITERQFKRILRENLKNNTNFEYQIRDIDGSVYYKRKKGDKLWSFTNCADFLRNANYSNTI